MRAANRALHMTVRLQRLPFHELCIEEHQLAHGAGPHAAQNFQSFGGLQAANDAHQGG